MTKIAIFDFDGTIADTNKGILKTYQETLRRLGLPNEPDDKITAAIGLPLRGVLKAISAGMTDELAEQGAKIYRSIFNDIAVPHITLFPGVKETLEAIRSRGMKLAIATSRGNDSLRFLAEHLGITGMFDGMFGEECVSNHKPAPDLVNLILETYGISKDEAIVIGDTTFDIGMGNAAGCRTCGVTIGNHSREKLLTAQPTYIVDSFSEVLEVL